MRNATLTACMLCVTAALVLARGDEVAPRQSVTPAGPGESAALPDPYEILLKRSIFAAGGKSARTVALGIEAQPHAAAALLALRGIRQQGNRFTALLEDLSTGRTVDLRAGDPLAEGRIIEITLHALKYAAGGRSIGVQVGQTLNGADAPESSTASGAAPSSPSHDRQRPH